MLLQMKNVQKQYPQFKLNCSLEVAPGRVIGLVGQNGAGKSTAFKAVLNLIRTDGGEVLVFGKPADQMTREEKAGIGVVMAESGFSGNLTVKEVANVLDGMYPGVCKKEFLERCGSLGLPLDKRIREFSTGMRAKLKVLAAISHDVRLLLLDEPTAGLDVVARDGLLEMLQDFMERDEERAILISSHISSDLETLCDDLYMVHQGKVVLHEDTDVLLSDYGILKVDEQQFQKLDREYLLRYKKEGYGYSCLTNQRQYYMENCPGIVVEKGNVDEVITMMVGGAEV